MNPYEELAYAICKTACDDYIDALILKNRGWLTTPSEVEAHKKKVMKKLWRTVISYGDRRYVYRKKTDNRIVRQTQDKNIEKCYKIMDLIDEYEHMVGPDKEIYECERFFRSERFSIFMPDIDPEELITALRAKASRGERSAPFAF